ncbi:hypothetical protein [Streptomyces albogriseolus]|uniref:hypothetical protein n=1 Tax=Streptomyces albogriseolus TaxID=1887 RepID=UPI0022599297|nr:hypothetical protein [Streptomyces viridodiastaticus]MCX4624382.1 hypothetical protein [Streptomyces viridodiastaticus]
MPVAYHQSPAEGDVRRGLVEHLLHTVTLRVAAGLVPGPRLLLEAAPVRRCGVRS